MITHQNLYAAIPSLLLPAREPDRRGLSACGPHHGARQHDINPTGGTFTADRRANVLISKDEIRRLFPLLRHHRPAGLYVCVTPATGKRKQIDNVETSRPPDRQTLQPLLPRCSVIVIIQTNELQSELRSYLTVLFSPNPSCSIRIAE